MFYIYYPLTCNKKISGIVLTFSFGEKIVNFWKIVTYYILYNFDFYSNNIDTFLCIVGGVLKSFSINVSDRDTANFLKDFLNDNLKKCLEISIEENNGNFLVNIFFLNNNKKIFDDFSYYFSSFVIDNYEKKIIDFIIENEYFYFSSNDKNYIYSIYTELNNISFENECFSSIKKNIKYYLNNCDLLDLNGFVFFGIYEYTEKIKNKVSEAINSFVIEKEYENFLEMIKSYIENSTSKMYKVHLVYLNSNATLLDDDGNEIKLEDISSNHIMSDFDFSKNDYVLNTLISIAPKKIVLHLLSPSDNFIDAIYQIFTSRVTECKNCKYCKNYHNSI